MLGYHISITRHPHQVLPDQGIITGKVEQPEKSDVTRNSLTRWKGLTACKILTPRKSLTARKVYHPIMVASGAFGQQWFS